MIDCKTAAIYPKSADLRKSGRLLNWLLFLFLLGVVACGGENPAAQNSVKAPASADAAMLDMLTNIQQNGLNKAANQGRGGLWINWRYGSSPLQVNLNDTGDPDGPSMPVRHDLLTDLRYVHGLWLYKSLHPGDARFDGEIKHYAGVLEQEQADIQNNERGWLYDELIDIYNLSREKFYLQMAYDLASHFFTSMYHPETGMIYNVDAHNQHGFYRVDLALEAACALIQASTIFNQPQWREAGQRVLQNMYATAYVRNYHVFLNMLENVVLPDGKLNPNPGIFRGLVKTTQIEGGQVRLGAAAQEILSLLHVYSITHDKTFLDRATDLLDPLSAEPNALGLWDLKQEGYFSAFIFPGPDMQHLGMPRVYKGMKEAGRQLQMLEAFRVANRFTNNRYQKMQDALLYVALNKAYYAPGHGVVYEMAPDWQIIVLKNGKRLDWVTTEAMGIVMESLGATLRPEPW